MATVHFGRLLGPVGFSRTVAVKRLHPQYAKDPEFVSMFLDEARLAARIRHPNVVQTLDVVTTADELFLVMDYVQGESLARLLRAVRAHNARVPPAIATAILSGVLHGLHAAHEAKNERGEPLAIVHRDVSPQNVIVGTDGVTRVLDFGIAKASDRLDTTPDGRVKGKLAYMPPEHLRGGEVTRQGDIYSAAVVLWEVLTSERLFGGDNEGAVVAQVLEGRIARPSQRVPGLSRAFDDVTLKGLSRDISRRFATAREMALALERCMPLAPPSEIGDWVETNAGAVLALRATRIREMESAPSLPMLQPLEAQETSAPTDAPFVKGVKGESRLSAISASSSGPSSGAARSERRRVSLIIGGICAVILAVATVGVIHERRGVPAAPPPSTLALSSTVAAPPLPEREGVAVAPAETPALPVSPPPPTAPATAEARSGARPFRPASAATRKNCDPPYTLDAEGHKHYKSNCL
jgi:serine/threonine protein kinase